METVGAGLIVIGMVTVFEQPDVVAVSVTLYVPAVAQDTLGGVIAVEVEGVPPVNAQE
jgi:hypothetical protein